MSKKLKHNKTKIKISKPAPEEKEYPAVSFRYLTRNKSFNLDCDKADSSTKVELLMRLEELTHKTYLEWFGQDKKLGFEMLTYKQMNFESDMDIAKDDKVIVMRFDNGTKRIIANKVNEIFYIIGLDFDYSAYDHGK